MSTAVSAFSLHSILIDLRCLCSCITCDFELMVGRDTRVVSTTLEAGFAGFAWGHVLRGYFVTTAAGKSLVPTLFVKCGIHSQCSIFVRIDDTQDSALNEY